METDAALLHAYAGTRDSEPFQELVRRYAGYVFGVALRVTGNRHDAEDVTQECFLALARSAGTITSSPAGWLHTVAVRRAANLRRNEATRRKHEASAETRDGSGSGPTWAEVAPHVDAALDRLPEGLRTVLVLYHVRGLTQSEIAAELATTQATVSRRVKRGIDLLRRSLRRSGVIVPATVLATLFTTNASPAAPPALAVALGRMAIAGVGTGGAAAVGVSAGSVGGLTLTRAALAALVVVGAAAGVGILMRERPDAVQPMVAAAQAVGPVGNPAPVADEPDWPGEPVAVVGLGMNNLTVAPLAPGRWIYIGGDLQMQWSYAEGHHLEFTQEGQRIYLATDRGPPRLAGVKVESNDHLPVLLEVLATEPGPLTVWCLRTNEGTLRTLTQMPNTSKIESLVLSNPGAMREPRPLLDFSPLAGLSNLRSLYIQGCWPEADIAAVGELAELFSLNLSTCNVPVLPSLAKLKQLRYMELSGNVPDISGLAGAGGLRHLLMVSCHQVTDISPLAELTELRELGLFTCSKVTDLSPLAGLRLVRRLVVSGAKGVTDVSALAGMTDLRTLVLWSCEDLRDLSALSHLTELEGLSLASCGVEDLAPIAQLGRLDELSINKCRNLRSLPDPADWPSLARVFLRDCPELADISALSGAPMLTELVMTGCPKIASLEPLADLPFLTDLTLTGCEGVTDLSPLAGMVGQLGQVHVDERLAPQLQKLKDAVP